MIDNPLDQLVADVQWEPDWHGVLTRVGESPGRETPTSLRSRRRVVALAVLVALLVIGTAVAKTTNWLTTGWLTGTRAPESVVDDFGSYRRQLGFHPLAGRAVLVAEDGQFGLYATINSQGSYCVLASAPWKRPNRNGEGGTCVPPAAANVPTAAGLVGSASDKGSGEQTFLIAGRVDDPEAVAIRFTDPDGNRITRALGSSGFFIAAIHTADSPCANGDWKPVFETLNTNGRTTSERTITLAAARSPQTCTFSFGPHP